MRSGLSGSRNTHLVRMTLEWRQPLCRRQGVRRNRRVLVVMILEMVQDLPDDARLGDELGFSIF